MSDHHGLSTGWVFLTWTLAAAAVQPGCEGGREAAPAVTLTGDDVVLATVEGEPISRYDLELSLFVTYGPKAARKFGPKARRSVLESLVASRAMAIVRRRELDPKQRAALEKRVAAYREKLLVEQYLAAHAPVEKVSQEAIERYYKEHPERFGAKSQRTYEMLVSARSLAGPERKDLLARMTAPGDRADWPAWAKELEAAGLPVDYRTGPVADRLLNPRLAALMSRLGPGKASPVTFVGGRAYAVRILAQRGSGPKPLAEVRDRIVEILEPRRLKKSIEKASAQVLGKVEVQYHGKIASEVSDGRAR